MGLGTDWEPAVFLRQMSNNAVAYPRTTSKRPWYCFSPLILLPIALCLGGVFLLASSSCACGGGAAKKTMSLSNLKQLVVASISYAGDHDDKLPTDMRTLHPLAPYLKSVDVTKSYVGDRRPFRANLVLAGKKLGEIHDPEHTIVYYEPASWPDGKRAVAFADGHARRLPEATVVSAVATHKGVVAKAR